MDNRKVDIVYPPVSDKQIEAQQYDFKQALATSAVDHQLEIAVKSAEKSRAQQIASRGIKARIIGAFFLTLRQLSKGSDVVFENFINPATPRNTLNNKTPITTQHNKLN